MVHIDLGPFWYGLGGMALTMVLVIVYGLVSKYLHDRYIRQDTSWWHGGKDPAIEDWKVWRWRR